MRRNCLIAILAVSASCSTTAEQPLAVDGAAATVPDAAETSQPDARSNPAPDAHEAADGAVITPDAMLPPDATPPPPDAAPRAYEGMIWLLEKDRGEPAGGAGGRMIPGNFWGVDGGSYGKCIVYTNVPLTGGDAGNIKIEGARTYISMDPEGGSAPLVQYKRSTASLPANLFDPGDVITFTGAGGPDVGAFTQTVPAPDKLSGVTLPSKVTLAEPFTVTWDAPTTEGAGDFMLVWLSTWPTPGLVSCTVPDTGSYTVPLGALALIPADNDQAIFQIYRINQRTVHTGPSFVNLWVADMFDPGDALDIVP